MSTTLRTRSQIRLGAALLVAFVVAALGGPVAASVQSDTWVVPAGSILPTGSVVVGSFPIVDALVVESPTAPEGATAFDAPLDMQSLPADADPVTGLRVDSGVWSTGAPEVWNTGEHGERAVVALVDTGVAPVAALENSVVGEIDFTGTGGGDGYGHGTFMASLIAANHQLAPGVAPHTGILSLKVGRADGTTSLGSVLGAMQWLHSIGRFAGIRVATLALGVDADTDAAKLLDAASDTLANSGMLVVTAAGNDGPGNLTSPATAADTFSVGAFDDAGTTTTADDTAADYSGSGTDRAGVAQPDITASGTKIVSWIPSNSVIATDNPAARVEGVLLRGSGTSMATALTAGVAALASSTRPDLSGHQLADVLRASGPKLDATAVIAAAEAAPQGKGVRSKWETPIEAPGANGKHKGHVDNADPNGVRWGGVRWGGVRWGGVRWGGVRWGGSSWADEQWEPGTWGGVRWTNGGWTADPAELTTQGIRWGGVRWGSDEWNGLRWGNSEWNGLRWGSSDWNGLRWGNSEWNGLRWGGASWSMLEAPPT